MNLVIAMPMLASSAAMTALVPPLVDIRSAVLSVDGIEVACGPKRYAVTAYLDSGLASRHENRRAPGQPGLRVGGTRLQVALDAEQDGRPGTVQALRRIEQLHAGQPKLRDRRHIKVD